jgi:hypothetical protein
LDTPSSRSRNPASRFRIDSLFISLGLVPNYKLLNG